MGLLAGHKATQSKTAFPSMLPVRHVAMWLSSVLRVERKGDMHASVQRTVSSSSSLSLSFVRIKPNRFGVFVHGSLH